MATYNLQILAGLTSDRSFLSCTPDGEVNLWNEDDGSGRQRWQLQGPHFDPSTA